MTYFERIEKTIEFIESNLTNTINLDKVASSACLSKYHFHRIFSALIGETIGDYVRKRRLTEASKELINTNNKIADIAYYYQFESTQSFSRAFKKHFRVTPSQYRDLKHNKLFFERKKLTQERLELIKAGNFNPVFKQISEEIKVTGMEIKTSLNNNTISSLWENFCKRLHEIPNTLNTGKLYEICKLKVDFDINTFNEDSEFIEMAGIPVSNFSSTPKNMTTIIIPKGKYAVFTHKGKTQDLHKTYEYIWGVWASKTNKKVDLRYDFEEYDIQRFKGPDNPETEIDIYIPINE